jgi:WD40 repeat protein
MEKDPELMGLLAVQAFAFNKNNQGKPEDPIIFEALTLAYSILDSSHHSVLKGSPNEIRVLRETHNGLLSADLDGQIRIWNPDGTINKMYSLPVTSPVNFIGSDPAGEQLITQHDNNDLLLWDIKPSDAEYLTFKVLKGHVSTIAFCSDKKYLATAGRDSSVIIWNINEMPALKINSLKTMSAVRTIIFCNADSVIYAQEDGNIILWDIKLNKNIPFYTSVTEKPLCLAWDENRKILFAGCSNGTLLLFNMIKGISFPPAKYIVHTAGIDLIAFNSDFSLLATSSWDKTIKFYNYHEFFELENAVGGAEHIKNLNERTRSLIFTGNNELVGALSDKSIRIWETSSAKLASMICDLVKRDMTNAEWNEMVGAEIPYENTCSRRP